MKVLFVGGGTGGSVTPLIAIAQYLKAEVTNIQCVWFGTASGPEKKLVMAEDIIYYRILSGKLRRYFSLKNFIDIFLVFFGVIQSFLFLIKIKPDVIVSAGSYVAVPVGIAAWILRIPHLIHQQDLLPGLANKILSYLAKTITVSYPEEAQFFKLKKVVYTGNPVRFSIFAGNKEKARELLGLEQSLPTILVVGGGTGALRLNQLVTGALPELLTFCQIIHITGKNKKFAPLAVKNLSNRYHQFDFLVNEIPDILAIADLVITRAGMGFLTELSALSKASIIIPMPNSHQEINAKYFCEKKATLCFDQNSLSSQSLVQDIKDLIYDQASLNFLRFNINKLYQPDATKLLVEEILKLTHEYSR